MIRILVTVCVIIFFGGIFWGLFVHNIYFATEMTGQFRVEKSPVAEAKIVREITSSLLKDKKITDTIYTDDNGFFILPERKSLKLGVPLGQVVVYERVKFYRKNQLVKELYFSHWGKKYGEMTYLQLDRKDEMVDADFYIGSSQDKVYRAEDFTLRKTASRLDLDLFCKGIVVEIKREKQLYEVGEAIQLTFSIQNNTSANYRFLPWQTPFEGELTAHSFRGLIYGPMDSFKYIGKEIKRPAATDDDFITIAPRTQKTIILDIAKYYDFTEKGRYEFYYLENELNGLPQSNKVEIYIR